MRDFDATCLTLVEQLSGKEIQKMREDAGVSQEIFARYLNVKERGEKKPPGPVPQAPISHQSQRPGGHRLNPHAQDHEAMKEMTLASSTRTPCATSMPPASRSLNACPRTRS